MSATFTACPPLAGLLPGQTFAHEIAHVLDGIHRHSEAGILKPEWTPDDYRDMLRLPLEFTPVDADLIRAGLARRSVSPRFFAGACETDLPIRRSVSNSR